MTRINQMHHFQSNFRNLLPTNNFDFDHKCAWVKTKAKGGMNILWRGEKYLYLSGRGMTNLWLSQGVNILTSEEGPTIAHI